MELPENPILRGFAVIFAIVFAVVALGYVGVLGLVIAVSLPNDTQFVSTAPERTTTTDIYLRNRTLGGWCSWWRTQRYGPILCGGRWQ